MAETRQVVRGLYRVPPADWPGGTGGALNVGATTPTPDTGATLLRSISFPSVHVSVGTPGTGTPPENWWQEATLTWFLWASASPTSGIPGYGDEPAVVFTGRLQPTLVASPSQPTSYYVRFECPPNGFESRGMRKATSTNPQYLRSGLSWEDPMAGMDGATYPATGVDVRTLDIGIFGIPV